ncbi:unnamed protein product [Closterium sp. NIES-64]|nr:unnamed protein product [Closterium sp. NIES-64]
MKAGPDDVFWFVEMHFLLSRLPKWSLQEYPRILVCGECVITVGILFNAAGNCTALPLVVLRPDERPDSSRINPGELEVVVRYTKSRRLTPEIFTEYMDEINNDHFSKDRRVVILVCNEGHRIKEPVSLPTVEHGFHVEHLLCMGIVNVVGAVPAMCMPHLNGVVDAFKVQYRVFLMRRALRSSECQHRYSAPLAVVDNYDMLRWIGEAWAQVSSATMQRSWWRVGCVPVSWTSSLGHLHGTFGAGMYEPLVSTTVDLQMLIEQFKIELGTYMSAVEYVDCNETLLEEASIEFEPISSGSSGGGGELCIPEGPLMRDPRSRRRVIRSVTQAYTRHADALGIPPASVPAEVGALNQEVISRLRRTPVKRSRTVVTPDEGSSLA